MWSSGRRSRCVGGARRRGGGWRCGVVGGCCLPPLSVRLAVPHSHSPLLQLLGELLLDRTNFHIMMHFIQDKQNLKLAMNLLRSTSPSIQFEAFHVFKVFVANPKKPDAIAALLYANRERLVAYLEQFQAEKGARALAGPHLSASQLTPRTPRTPTPHPAHPSRCRRRPIQRGAHAACKHAAQDEGAREPRRPARAGRRRDAGRRCSDANGSWDRSGDGARACARRCCCSCASTACCRCCAGGGDQGLARPGRALVGCGWRRSRVRSVVCCWGRGLVRMRPSARMARCANSIPVRPTAPPPHCGSSPHTSTDSHANSEDPASSVFASAGASPAE